MEKGVREKKSQLCIDTIYDAIIFRSIQATEASFNLRKKMVRLLLQ